MNYYALVLNTRSVESWAGGGEDRGGTFENFSLRLVYKFMRQGEVKSWFTRSLLAKQHSRIFS